MNKFSVFTVAAISAVSTALLLGWKYELGYWQHIRSTVYGTTITTSHEVKDGAQPLLAIEAPTIREAKAEKPSDKEAADTWVSGVKAARARDPNWMPPVYTKLGDLKAVQNCQIEFTVVQIDDANTRIVSHQGERVWLVGPMPGLVNGKSYTCKGLFAPIGTYQPKTVAEGTRTLAAYRFSGEAPDVLALRN